MPPCRCQPRSIHTHSENPPNFAVPQNRTVEQKISKAHLILGITGYTQDMKTAISIPDDVFKRAEYLAKKQGISRSEFYVTAITAYIAKRRASVTDMLDAVYADENSIDEQIEHAALADMTKGEW